MKDPSDIEDKPEIFSQMQAGQQSKHLVVVYSLIVLVIFIPVILSIINGKFSFVLLLFTLPAAVILYVVMFRPGMNPDNGNYITVTGFGVNFVASRKEMFMRYDEVVEMTTYVNKSGDLAGVNLKTKDTIFPVIAYEKPGRIYSLITPGLGTGVLKKEEVVTDEKSFIRVYAILLFGLLFLSAVAVFWGSRYLMGFLAFAAIVSSLLSFLDRTWTAKLNRSGPMTMMILGLYYLLKAMFNF